MRYKYAKQIVKDVKGYLRPLRLDIIEEYIVEVPESYPYKKYTNSGPSKRRVDLFCEDKYCSYGIEIKRDDADLKSGSGLNQEMFDFGYVLIPEYFLEGTEEYLCDNGLTKTGIITITEHRELFLVKKAIYNGDEYEEDFERTSLIEYFLPSYYDHGAITISMAEFIRLKRADVLKDYVSDTALILTNSEVEELRLYKKKYETLLEEMSSVINKAERE